MSEKSEVSHVDVEKQDVAANTGKDDIVLKLVILVSILDGHMFYMFKMISC
jgi:hypothetical protein